MKKQTKETRLIESRLKEQFPDYWPDCPPAAYRYNSASIRVRVVSDRFRNKSLSEREDLLLPIVRRLPKDTQEDITILLLLSPEESRDSVLNLEFETPTPSTL
jgi:stress-induced morphogen